METTKIIEVTVKAPKAVKEVKAVKTPKAVKAVKEVKTPKTIKTIYKNTISITGKNGSKKIRGIGTISDLAKKLGNKEIPPTHGAVKVMEMTGHAKVRKDLSPVIKGKGRVATVYEFAV